MKEKIACWLKQFKIFCRKEWTFKVIPHHSKTSHTLFLRGQHLLLVVLCLLLAFTGVNYLVSLRVKKLEGYVKTLETKVAKKEQEKKEMTFLAEKKYQVLHKKLEVKSKEIKEIWRVVGKSPTSQNTLVRHRKSLLGSRGLAQPLMVRKSYYQVSQVLDLQEKELRELKAAAKGYRQKKEREALLERLCATPSDYPCAGYISSGYGYRGYEFHRGIDIATDYGTPIYASAAGTVVASGYDGGYGYAVEISHRSGLTSFYAHCSSLLVGYGQRVTKGQLIARVGCTGYSTDPHLHYEIRQNGTALNPMNYLSSSALAGR